MDNSIIKLYHGSKSSLKGNIKPINREGRDCTMAIERIIEGNNKD